MLAGAVGTVGGLLFGYFNGRAERSAAKTLARGSRIHALRKEAYTQLATFLERQRLLLARTEPIIVVGEGREPPPQPSDDEWTAIQGYAAVAGSEAVDAAVTEAQQAIGRFIGAVVLYRNTMNAGGNAYAEGGPREQMDNARTVAYDAIVAAQHAMRDELASL